MNKTKIVFSVDEKYIPYLGVAVQSLVSAMSADNMYTVYILHRNLAKTIREDLKKAFAGVDALEIVFLDVSDIMGNLYLDAENNGTGYLSESTYYRLFLPYLIPNEEKVLYLDCDIVVLEDVAHLFDIDIKDNAIGGVLDIADNWKCRDNATGLAAYRLGKLNMEDAENYVNAGVLLLNLKFFREHYTVEDIFNLIKSNKWEKHDQDVINLIADKRKVILPFKWNLIEILDDNARGKIDIADYANYEMALENPSIIHYAARKPWKEKNSFGFVWFWKNAAQTMWFEELLSAYQENLYSNEVYLQEKILRSVEQRKVGFRVLISGLIKAVAVRLKR